MARADDFMLTAEEIRLRTRKRRTIAIVALALVLLVALGFFGARPATNMITAWQARRHAQKAFAYIDQEKWTDAHKEAAAAYQLYPTEPQALRAVARFLSRTHQIGALDFWKQLAEKTSFTHQDLRDEAMVAIIASDAARADTAVHALIGSHPESADWLLAAQLSIQKNLPDEAKQYLAKIVADSRSTESEQFRATVLQFALAGDNQTEKANAITRLKKIAKGKTPASLDALVVLAQNALSIPAESSDSAAAHDIADLARALEDHPLAKAQHKLLALDLLAHHDPAQRDALVARAIANWKDAEPADVVMLADWLNGKSEFQKTLDVVPVTKARQSSDLFLRHLDALGGLGRWEEIKELLDSERFLLDPVSAAMYLARCNSQLREEIAAENNWQRALEAAQGDVARQLTLAQYAMKNGNTAIAEAAYNDVAAKSPRLRVAQDGRLQIAQMSHATKKLHTILAQMLSLWPNDPAIQNDEAYTRLLLLPADAEETRREAAAIEQLAQKLLEREPTSLPHRTLLALARLRQGRAADALNVYNNVRVAQNALSGSALAVHAAVLAGTAHAEDAKTEVAQIKPEQLLPEERSLIKPLLD